MWIVWDIIAIGLMALLVHLGAKKGFVRMLISLACYILAAVLARTFAPIAAQWLYDNHLAKAIAEGVVEQVNQALVGGATSGAQLLVILPAWMSGMLLSAFPNLEGMTLESLVGSGDVSANVASMVNSAIAKPVTQLLAWVFFLVTFLVLVIAIKLIARIFTGVNYLPMVGSLNMVMGGLLGAVQALVILVVIAVLISTFGVLAGGDVALLNPEAVQNSFIMGSLYRLIFVG